MQRTALWVDRATRDAVVALKRGRDSVDDVVRRLIAAAPSEDGADGKAAREEGRA